MIAPAKSDQQEDAGALADIAIVKAQMAARSGATPGQFEGQFSGTKIENFREGWALRAMPWSAVAHYFRVFGQEGLVVARCGHQAQARWMYGQGDFKRCRDCQRSVDRRPPAG